MTKSFQKLVVIGCTGTGKTTFCDKLSKKSGIQHIELDSLNWLPNWTPALDFPDRVNNILRTNEQWIIDGNNEKVRAQVWQQSDAIIWLNFNFFIVMYRLFIRTLQRLIFRKKLWNDNQERWSVVLSWNSVLLWGITMWFRYRKEFPDCFARYPSKRIIVLNSPSEAEDFIHHFASCEKLMT